VDDRVRSPNTLRCVTATTSLSISPLSPEEPITLLRLSSKSSKDILIVSILLLVSYETTAENM
ncbi:mucin-5AC-like isoform X3, partial [Vespula squamosa]